MKFDFFNSVEQRFWKSEVQSLMGTQNFFFVPRCWKNKNHLSLKITLFICALITKGNVTFSLEKDLKLILFQLYFIITLYESLLVFFFWSRNEWSNVGLLVSKNIHLIVSQDLLREKISPVFKVLHMNHLNYYFNPENITLPFWYYQCCTWGTDSQHNEEICIQSTLETHRRKPSLHWQSCWILSSYWNC